VPPVDESPPIAPDMEQLVAALRSGIYESGRGRRVADGASGGAGKSPRLTADVNGSDDLEVGAQITVQRRERMERHRKKTGKA